MAQQFSRNDRVDVVGGSYKGCSGTVEGTTPCMAYVRVKGSRGCPRLYKTSIVLIEAKDDKENKETIHPTPLAMAKKWQKMGLRVSDWIEYAVEVTAILSLNAKTQ